MPAFLWCAQLLTDLIRLFAMLIELDLFSLCPVWVLNHSPKQFESEGCSVLGVHLTYQKSRERGRNRWTSLRVFRKVKAPGAFAAEATSKWVKWWSHIFNWMMVEWVKIYSTRQPPHILLFYSKQLLWLLQGWTSWMCPLLQLDSPQLQTKTVKQCKQSNFMKDKPLEWLFNSISVDGHITRRKQES